MKEDIFTITDNRLEILRTLWDKLPIKIKEDKINTYFNLAVIAYEKLLLILEKPEQWKRKPFITTHSNDLYYNAFLALYLYIDYTNNWDKLKDDYKKFSLLFWELNKGQFAFSLFKYIGRNSRERTIILKDFHQRKLLKPISEETREKLKLSHKKNKG